MFIRFDIFDMKKYLDSKNIEYKVNRYYESDIGFSETQYIFNIKNENIVLWEPSNLGFGCTDNEDQICVLKEFASSIALDYTIEDSYF